MSTIKFEREFASQNELNKNISPPIIQPSFIPIHHTTPTIDPCDLVAIIRDRYNDVYKCIPIKLLSKHRVIWDDYYESINCTFSARITPITISYCPYSRSTVIYENLWKHSNFMYNSNCILENPKTQYIQQMTGRVMDQTCKETQIYPKRYAVEIYKWNKWLQHQNFNRTVIIKEYFTNNINYNNVHPFHRLKGPINNIKHLKNFYEIGLAFFHEKKDGSKEGKLFITINTLSKTNEYNQLINKTFHIQCCIGVWNAFFPFSVIL